MYNRVGAGVLLAVMLATGGCDKQATGQSVAVVNGEEISQSELNEELAAANVPESVDKKVVMPQLLQRIIDRRLVAQQAKEQGLDKTPDYLSRERRADENLLIALYTQRQQDAIKAPTPAEIDKFMADNPAMFAQREMLVLDQLAFQRPADITLLRQLENDHSLDAVAASLTRLGIPFQKGRGQLDTATVPPQVAQQVKSLPAGEPFVAPAGDRIIVSVIAARQAAPPPQDAARRVAGEQVKRRKLMETLDGQLKQLKTAAKIEYQPGFEPKEGADKAAPAAPAATPPAKAGS